MLDWFIVHDDYWHIFASMKKTFLLFAICGLSKIAMAQTDERLIRICEGRFAFCGASSAEPTGGTIVVEGKKFKEGMSVCPVMVGPSIANMALMDNSCATPDGTDSTVWSLFWYYDSVAQSPTWEQLPTVNRTFVTTNAPGGGMSNMWCMPCRIWKRENGVTLAKCYGPINEAAFPLRRAKRVRAGKTSVTQAPIGAPNPVGTVIPVADN